MNGPMTHDAPARASIQPPVRRDASYRLTGQFLEACDCYSICPCWVGRSPDDGECTGLFVWLVEHGEIDGVNVKGRMVASASYHAGHRDRSHQRVVVFVDEDATDKQADALVAALTGSLGGPLGELSTLLGELAGIERASISAAKADGRWSVTVGRRARVEASPILGPDGGQTKLTEGHLAEVLGSPADVGRSDFLRLNLPGYGMDVELRGRGAMSGRFEYIHAPGRKKT
jgi:hypothetical protein